MKNITVTVDNDVYQAARVWAAQRGTSISRVVQFLLSDLPRLPRAQRAFPAIIPDSALVPPLSATADLPQNQKTGCETV